MSSERWLEQGSLFDSTPSGSGTSVWLPTQNELWHGGCWTADISEWPSGGDGFLRVSLSEILLRIGPDERYWLSPKALKGIQLRQSRIGVLFDVTWLYSGGRKPDTQDVFGLTE